MNENGNNAVTESLLSIIPISLDDIVRTNRDQFSLGLMTPEDLLELERQVVPQTYHCKKTLMDWHLITLTVKLNSGGFIKRHSLVGTPDSD